MFQPGCGLFAVRCPGAISEQNWEQGGEMGRAIESLAWKASDTLVMMMPVHLVMKDHEWYLESPCRAKSLHSKDYLSLPWGGNKRHILIIFCLSSLCFCFFCCWFFMFWWDCSLGREGDWASGRGSLELWASESFSGLGSRSADEARLNIANHSWKICTCARTPFSTPATPGLALEEQLHLHVCKHTHLLTHAHAYAPYNWKERSKA